jgi:hypothetical protein
MSDPETERPVPPAQPERREPGGPYFGRLLIVLFAAVAFCAIITWVLSSTMMN